MPGFKCLMGQVHVGYVEKPLSDFFLLRYLSGLPALKEISRHCDDHERSDGKPQLGNLYVADTENNTIRKGMPPLQFRNWSRANGLFRFQLIGAASSSYVIQGSIYPRINKST